MDQMKGYILPRSNAEKTAPSYDGQYDPLGDEELLTIEKRGSFLKDTNGKLYYPTSGGYQRTKNVVPYMSHVVVTTTDDTVVAITAVPSTVGSVNTNQIVLVYQNSGGALTFYIYADSGKANVIYSQSITSGVPTVLTCAEQKWGSVWIAWSAAAGGGQYAIRNREYLAAVAVN